MNAMEQARRNLKDNSPDLYGYIANIEGAQALAAAEVGLVGAASGAAAIGVVAQLLGVYRKRAAVMQLAPPRRR